MSKGREYNDERDMAAFWAAVRPRREPVSKRWYIPLALILVALSIPWYWPEGWTEAVAAGMPLWVWVTVGCSTALATLTATMALWFWDDDPDDETDRR